MVVQLKAYSVREMWVRNSFEPANTEVKILKSPVLWTESNNYIMAIIIIMLISLMVFLVVDVSTFSSRKEMLYVLRSASIYWKIL